MKIPNTSKPSAALNPSRRSAWGSWNDLVKGTVARFARGNIAAQHGLILFPAEQMLERERVYAFTRKWKKRAQS